MGLAKLKSKLSFTRISASSLTIWENEIDFFSSSESRLTILEKLGDIGYSNLAASRMDTVANKQIFSLGYVCHPITARYLSRMEHATKRVSFL